MAGSEKATAEAPASPQDGAAASESAETLPGGYTFRFLSLDEVCARHVREALEIFRWNFSQAAPALGVDRRTLYRMTQRWGIARPERHPKARAAPAALIPSEAEQSAFSALEALPGSLGEMFAEGAFTELTDEPEQLLPGTWGETVLASGSAQPGGLIRDVLLPRPSEAPPAAPSQEFENFGHLPTLEIDK